MTRLATGLIAMFSVLIMLGLDISAAPPNPFNAPPIIALGSGQSSAGGFCGQLPE